MSIINCISCYCDTEDKLVILKNNIESFKELGIDSAVISPIPIPLEIQSMVKYCMITDYNPVFDWPERANAFWRSFSVKDKSYKLWTTHPDYGWTTVSQFYTMGEVLFNYGYDKIVFSQYDVSFNKSHIDEINENKGNLFFPTLRDNGDFFSIALHLCCLNKKYFTLLKSIFTMDSYLKNEGILEYVLLNIIKDKDFVVSDNSVGDKCNITVDFEDYFNLSSNDGFKFFVSNEDNKIKVFIYENKMDFKFSVLLNNKKFFVTEYEVFDTDLTPDEIDSLLIFYDSHYYDITDKVKKIKHNLIEVYNE